MSFPWSTADSMRVGTLLGVHRKGKREVDQPNWFRLVDGNELLWTLAESGGQGPLLPSAPAVETASDSLVWPRPGTPWRGQLEGALLVGSPEHFLGRPPAGRTPVTAAVAPGSYRYRGGSSGGGALLLPTSGGGGGGGQRVLQPTLASNPAMTGELMTLETGEQLLLPPPLTPLEQSVLEGPLARVPYPPELARYVSSRTTAITTSLYDKPQPLALQHVPYAAVWQAMWAAWELEERQRQQQQTQLSRLLKRSGGGGAASSLLPPPQFQSDTYITDMYGTPISPELLYDQTTAAAAPDHQTGWSFADRAFALRRRMDRKRMEEALAPVFVVDLENGAVTISYVSTTAKDAAAAGGRGEVETQTSLREGSGGKGGKSKAPSGKTKSTAKQMWRGLMSKAKLSKKPKEGQQGQDEAKEEGEADSASGGKKSTGTKTAKPDKGKGGKGKAAGAGEEEEAPEQIESEGEEEEESVLRASANSGVVTDTESTAGGAKAVKAGKPGKGPKGKKGKKGAAAAAAGAVAGKDIVGSSGEGAPLKGPKAKLLQKLLNLSTVVSSPSRTAKGSATGGGVAAKLLASLRSSAGRGGGDVGGPALTAGDSPRTSGGSGMMSRLMGSLRRGKPPPEVQEEAVFGDVEEPRGAGSGRGSPTPSGLATSRLGSVTTGAALSLDAGSAAGRQAAAEAQGDARMGLRSACPPMRSSITLRAFADDVPALCTLLGIAMAGRFNNTKKFFPAGLVALSSLGLAAAFVGVGL
eukprot:XP_001694315.1 predicted protein [Chlamydomonas reinhardtii]